jgi:uncharacterized protein (DUF885 family)
MMNLRKTLKATLLSVCSLSLLMTGCSASQNTTTATEQTKTDAVSQESTPDDAFDALTQELFAEYASSSTLNLNYTVKNPSDYGIEADEVSWGTVDFSDEDIAEAKAQTQSYLDRLEEISGLTGDRAVTYDVVKYYLEADLESYDYIYQTMNLAPRLGVQSQLPITMAEYHFDDTDDVEDYLTLLNTFGDYAKELIDFENKKADAGYGMCKSLLEQSIEECNSFISSDDTNMLIDVFPEKLDDLELTEEEKQDYIAQNEEAVLNSVIPAYQTLIDGLSAQLDTAPENGSLSSYENGQDYYRYLLKASVGTDKTPEELIELTEEKLYTNIFSLSYLMNSNPDIYDEVDAAEYSLSDPDEIIAHFKETLTEELMPEAPEVSYTLKDVPEALSASLSPAMYFIPRIDDITNNQIYMNLTDNYGNELMPTLAHEGYPGHMYQVTYYYDTDPDPIRTVLESSGYVEGWASYVEALSYDYCGFSDDVASFYRTFYGYLMPNLYCRIDLGIHYEGWTLDDTTEYVRQYLNVDDDGIEQMYDIILATPTNYLIYGIGMDEIQELRDTLAESLRTDFDIKEFHKQLLDLGPAPFSILRKYMIDAAETTETEALENAA